MNETLRLQDFMEELKKITNKREFREFVDENLINLYETPDLRIPSKLKADLGGALYFAIHGSVDL